MIRYALRCEAGHAFEAWFRDSAAFDAQRAEGRVACGVCGSVAVEKAPMAPSVAAGAAPRATAGAAPARTTDAKNATPADPAPLAVLRAHLEANADYVGSRFAAEARRIHDQGGAERPVWGEATPDQARALLRDGVPVTPLPRLPRRDD